MAAVDSPFKTCQRGLNEFLQESEMYRNGNYAIDESAVLSLTFQFN